jgi:hypothetical protein
MHACMHRRKYSMHACMQGQEACMHACMCAYMHECRKSLSACKEDGKEGGVEGDLTDCWGENRKLKRDICSDGLMMGRCDLQDV